MNGLLCLVAIFALLKGGVTFYQETQQGYKTRPRQVRQNVRTCKLFALVWRSFQYSSAKALLTWAECQWGIVRTIQHVARFFRFLKTEVTTHTKNNTMLKTSKNKNKACFLRPLKEKAGLGLQRC